MGLGEGRGGLREGKVEVFLGVRPKLRTKLPGVGKKRKAGDGRVHKGREETGKVLGLEARQGRMSFPTLDDYSRDKGLVAEKTFVPAKKGSGDQQEQE